MLFSTLASTLKYDTYGCADKIDISKIACKSSECDGGTVFAALRGEKSDGHDYIYDAYERGARAFIVERPVKLPSDAAYAVAENSRSALARASLLVFGSPEKHFGLIGVTGTKGKSTVVSMIHKTLEMSGKNAVSISTLGLLSGGVLAPSENTTPESNIIAKFLADAKNIGADHAVIEVSSQGIKQHRTDGLTFDVGVLTNISRDHIGRGEHESFSEYKACKKEMLRRSSLVVLNADDAHFGEFSDFRRVKTYGISSPSDIMAKNVKNVRRADGFGVEFDVVSGGDKAHLFVPIPGKFAVYDALAAIAACAALGVPLDVCAAALAEVKISGRFEKVPVERDIDVVIDYAHNGASLKSALITAKSLARGKVICVFGSVGGRTKIRRAALGKAADRYADICFLTSDNPNFENPLDILTQIADNIHRKPFYIVADREEAIRRAIDTAQDGDFVLICGKGHEKYQLVDGKKLPFDEKNIILTSSKIKANI